MSATAETLAKYFENKKILILGFGREGRSTYSFIRRYFPTKELGIADLKEISLEDEFATLYCGEDYLKAMADYELIMKSPGIAFVDVEVPSDCIVSCQTDLFLRFCDCTTIGITGTKGKTTTSSLIYAMLKQAGLDVCLIGNIGVPVFEDIEASHSSVAVIEMSSHQLEFTHNSPHIAVFTNIYEEHLDHYQEGFKGYVEAKLNIMKYQTSNDFFVYNADQDMSEFFDAEELRSKKFPVSIYSQDEFLNTLDGINPHLKGRHNRMDVFLAAKAAERLGVKNEDIYAAVKAYEGIEHRMEYVGRYGEVDYYNDSIATIPQAVLCAIEAIGNVGTLIIGGMDRGLDLSPLAEGLDAFDIANIICLPDTGHQVGDMMLKNSCTANIVKVSDMQEAVARAAELTPKRKACLMSPAAASYNVYRDFDEKGKHFKSLVRALQK